MRAESFCPLQTVHFMTAKADEVFFVAASRELAPGQAAQMIAALGTLAKIIEVDELAARITALEAKREDA